jgi:hypothetical protein
MAKIKELKMDNNLQSQLCIEISSVTKTGTQEIIQKIFATDLYVYVEALGKQLIYLPEKDAQYLIDTNKKQLLKINIPIVQLTQFSQIKQLIGELSVEEKYNEQLQRKYLHLTNVNTSTINIDIEVEAVRFVGLEKTMLSKFNEIQSKIQPFSVKLDNNEITVSMNSIMTVSGQIQKSNMKILELKKMDNPCQFDQYFYFPIVE